MRFFNSLAARLVGALLLASLLYAGVASYNSYQTALHESNEAFDDQLRQMAHTLLAVGALLDDSHPAEARRMPRHFTKAMHFQLWRAERGKLQLVLRSQDDAFDFSVARNLPEGFSDYDHADQRWRVFRLRQLETGLEALVAEKDDTRQELAREIAQHDIEPFVYGWPLLGLAAILLIHFALRPLRRLASELQSRSPNELRPIDLGQPPKEMVASVSAINRLMHELSRALDNERRFSSDAAHELRTPLAALRAQLDTARHATGEPAVQAEALDKAAQAARRLQHLITQLLFLSRLDVSAHLDRAALMLDEIAETVCADLAPDALAKGIDISLEAAPTPLAEGNRELLYALLRNLVDNAIRYTLAGGTVIATVSETPSGALLSVADSGSGVTPADMASLGQRFHRLAPSQAEGVGLGLSIVRRVAELHGASLRFVADETLGGLRVEVLFSAPA